MTAAFVKAISISLISIYTHTLIQKGKKEASKLICGCLEMMLPFVLTILLFAYMFTPIIAKLLAPSYSPSESALLQHFLRICFPFFVFSVITLIGTSVMDSNKDFVISRTESFITSTVTIICCVLLYKIQAVTSLIIAQYTSYIIFCLLLIFRGRKYINYSFVKLSEVPEIKTVLITALPLFIGNSVSQINKIIDNSVSTGLSHGSVTALSSAVVLEDFVCNILVTNVVDILYVNFSTYAAQGDDDALKATMYKALNVMICIMIPITIITCMCSTEIVSIAYHRGEFDSRSVAMTSAALIGYAIGFVVSGTRDIVIRALYAFKDTKRPMITGFFAVAANAVGSIVLSKYLGIMGVAIASSICLAVNFFINSFMLKTYIPEYSLLKILPVLLKQIPGSILLVIIITAVKKLFTSNLLIFMFSALIGLTLYATTLLFMRIDEVNLIKNKLLAKFRH